MSTTGFALPGGLPVPAAEAVALLSEAAGAAAPLFATEVAVHDAAALLSAVAVRAPDVSLGTGIIPLGSRSPAALAMAASTLAGLSTAEVLLGVGVSTTAIVEGWHDARWVPSVEATKARLRALRRLLDGERRGSFRLGVPPWERVRVLLGALGPRMVELGLGAAGGVICNLTPPEHLPAPRGDARVYAYLWVAVDDEAVSAARRDLVGYATTGPYGRHFRRLGFGDVVDEVAGLRAAGRLRDAPARLPEAFLDRLVVRPGTLHAHLAAVRAAGAVPVLLPFVPPGRDAVETARAVLDLLRAQAA
jgi:alkanesulfonate monooxygenase SsuD/methylene tetrahydromethanopterin reductase-like flavin-dependent oxidoreductase (luciferase family)